MKEQLLIDEFLKGAPHAVVGASNDRSKYGNKVLRCYQQHARPVFAINPRGGTIEGQSAYARLRDLPQVPHGVSLVVPPAATLSVVEEAAELGIKYVWMQPGSESLAAIARAMELGLHVIANGPCLLVALGYHE